MAYLILPSRRTRQPQGAVRVNSSGFARDAALIWCGTGYVDVASKASPTVNGYSQSTTENGIAYNSSSSVGNGNYIRFANNANNGRGGERTLFLWVKRLNSISDYWDSLFGNNGQSTGVNSFGFGAAATSTGGTANKPYFEIFDNSNVQSYTTFQNQIPVPTDRYQFLVGVANSSSVLLYQDGVLVSQSSLVGSLPLSSSYFWNIGDRNTGHSGAAQSVLLAGVLNRACSTAEIIDASMNPWGAIFAPDSRRIYFGASGGGANIFESTFATSWSLSEAYSTSATLVSTYADSPTVTDSSSSSAVFSSAFDETIPVSDGPSADMGGVANRTQEESFTITDAYSANMVATATISETLSAEASASASAIFNATFAETLPIVDGEEADAGRISDIAENVSVTDAYTAGIVAQATQAESVTTIDTYDTIAIYNPLLAETLPITDIVGATLTVPTSGTVDLSQESIDALALEIMNQLTSVPVRRL